MFAGATDIFFLLGVVSLFLAMLQLMHHTHMKTEIKKSKERLEFLGNSLSVKTQELDEAFKKYTSFRDSFDEISAKEKKRLKKEFAGAEEMFEFANNRSGTIDRLGKKLLNDTEKWVFSRMTPNNFTVSADRLRKVIDFCRKHEYEVEKSFESELLDKLRKDYEAILRQQHAKEEQTRIKARIREEQKAERELEKEMRRIEVEKVAIQKALDAALRIATDEHSAEIEALRDKLREAEEKGQRALSMAQQTKAGHVYVISNIGSFGEDIFKIGMTRRLEPLDRVKELGDASVPFPFDVHMMISCDDAPSLENALHKAFNARRLNKVNLRREFFRVKLDEIRHLVEANHGEVNYVAEPEALQYRESLQMNDEEFAFISSHAEELSFDDDDEYLE
ncbi:MAG: hypothetical protein GXP26_15250 [Planctomycetes bacterium]|nr:hypothetical protein [Planctomycetota bacterium]